MTPLFGSHLKSQYFPFLLLISGLWINLEKDGDCEGRTWRSLFNCFDVCCILRAPNVEMSFYVTDESQLAEHHKMQSTYARPLSYHEHDVTQMNVSLLKAELKDMSSDRDVLRDELAKVTIFFFFIFSHFYVGSMCLMRRLHLGQSCASSSDNPLSDKSFLMLSNHLRFGLPLLLFPGTSIPITLFPTYSSSLLKICPYHFNLLSCTFLDISPTFVVPLILSFLILSILVTPLIHLNILISATSTSRHRTSLLVLQLSCILSPWLSNLFFGRTESPISSSSFSMSVVFWGLLM